MKFLIMLFFVFFAGCTDNSYSSSNSYEIANYSAKEIEEYISKNIKKEHNYTFGYKAYKINYKTTDDNGNSVNASGVMVVPTLNGTDEISKNRLTVLQDKGFSMVLNCHGTVFANSKVPSVAIAFGKIPDAAGMLFSSIYGFVTLLPDYIGFGSSSSHYHPYLLKKSSANSVKDFINAAIKFANENDIPLNPARDVYLTGYSQGGYVAMSSIETIEKEPITLKLAVPIAGPYLLEPFGEALSKAKIIEQPAYAAALVYSYAKVYSKNLNDIFNKPYSLELDELLSGKYTKDEINKRLSTNSKELFKEKFLNDYPTSWFRLKLISNSAVSLNSSPFVDIKMIHCRGDNVVPYKIATSTKDILKITGANVELITVEDLIKSKNLNHHQCILPSYLIAADIFDKTRGE